MSKMTVITRVYCVSYSTVLSQFGCLKSRVINTHPVEEQSFGRGVYILLVTLLTGPNKWQKRQLIVQRALRCLLKEVCNFSEWKRFAKCQEFFLFVHKVTGCIEGNQD